MFLSFSDGQLLIASIFTLTLLCWVHKSDIKISWLFKINGNCKVLLFIPAL